MTTAAVREAETVTRSIARWGSLAAAVIFGIAFATDRMLTLEFVSAMVIQIALICLVFAGYALAWTRRYEVTGSIIALLAILGVYLYSLLPGIHAPMPIFLAVGIPALLHLCAVVLHRYVLPRARARARKETHLQH